MIIYRGYEVPSLAVDWAIAHYLPASPAQLRDKLAEVLPDHDWSYVTDVSAALIILAWHHHKTTALAAV